MTLDLDRLLDLTGWQILRELEANARLSFAELGRRVGLSLPAVAERVRRMEDAGIITGYQVRLDPTKVGRPISAFVRIRLHDHITCERLEQLLADLPEVLECHNLTGDDCAIVKVAVPTIPDLEQVIQRLKGFGQTTTSIVLSSFAHKGLAHASDRAAEDGSQPSNGDFVRQVVR
ncbi:MAG: Lrp/AsnC family transcriptional regulator [Anaerolineales bacterium]